MPDALLEQNKDIANANYLIVGVDAQEFKHVMIPNLSTRERLIAYSP